MAVSDSEAPGADDHTEQPPDALIQATTELLAAVTAITFPLDLPTAGAARKTRTEIEHILTAAILPRLRTPDAPLLCALAGPTGVGKSTLLNALAGAPVSATGPLRPTTRAAVLVCNPADVGGADGGGGDEGEGEGADLGGGAGADLGGGAVAVGGEAGDGGGEPGEAADGGGEPGEAANGGGEPGEAANGDGEPGEPGETAGSGGGAAFGDGAPSERAGAGSQAESDAGLAGAEPKPRPEVEPADLDPQPESAPAQSGAEAPSDSPVSSAGAEPQPGAGADSAGAEARLVSGAGVSGQRGRRADSGQRRRRADSGLGARVGAGLASLLSSPLPSPSLPRGVAVVDTVDGDAAVVAAADVVVVVVSAERYADAAVWRVLRRVGGYGVPVVVVLGRVLAGVVEEVAGAFGELLRVNGLGAVPFFVVEEVGGRSQGFGDVRGEVRGNAGGDDVAVGGREGLGGDAAHGLVQGARVGQGGGSARGDEVRGDDSAQGEGAAQGEGSVLGEGEGVGRDAEVGGGGALARGAFRGSAALGDGGQDESGAAGVGGAPGEGGYRDGGRGRAGGPAGDTGIQVGDGGGGGARLGDDAGAGGGAGGESEGDGPANAGVEDEVGATSGAGGGVEGFGEARVGVEGEAGVEDEAGVEAKAEDGDEAGFGIEDEARVETKAKAKAEDRAEVGVSIEDEAGVEGRVEGNRDAGAGVEGWGVGAAGGRGDVRGAAVVPEAAVAGLRGWLRDAGADTAGRVRIGMLGVAGRLDSVDRLVGELADAWEGQRLALQVLHQGLERVHTAERVRFRGLVDGGELFGGEVRIRWQELVGSGRISVLFGVEDGGRKRKRRKQKRGEADWSARFHNPTAHDPATAPLRAALLEAVARSYRAALERAERKTTELWELTPGAPEGDHLVDEATRRATDPARAAAAWLDHLPDLILEQAHSRRTTRTIGAAGGGVRSAAVVLGVAALAGRKGMGEKTKLE